MKHFIFSIFLFSFLFSFGQQTPPSITTTTAVATGDYLPKYNAAGGAGSGRVITVDNFTNKIISTYSIVTQATLPASGGTQTLSISGYSLSISGGNTVNLPVETQTLSISTNTITISGGNYITIPTYVSDQTVTFSSVGSNTVTGTYPNFTVTVPNLTNVIYGTLTAGYIPMASSTYTLTNSIIRQDAGTLGIGLAPTSTNYIGVSRLLVDDNVERLVNAVMTGSLTTTSSYGMYVSNSVKTTDFNMYGGYFEVTGNDPSSNETIGLSSKATSNSGDGDAIGIDLLSIQNLSGDNAFGGRMRFTGTHSGSSVTGWEIQANSACFATIGNNITTTGGSSTNTGIVINASGGSSYNRAIDVQSGVTNLLSTSVTAIDVSGNANVKGQTTLAKTIITNTLSYTNGTTGVGRMIVDDGTGNGFMSWQPVSWTSVGSNTITGTWPNLTLTTGAGAGGGVTSVSGTTDQITSSGGTTPVISLPNWILFPGAGVFTSSLIASPIYGSTASAGRMIIGSTSHATKDGIFIGTNTVVVVNETNKFVGINCYQPGSRLEITGAGATANVDGIRLSLAAVAHGMTTLVPTDVYGVDTWLSATAGGRLIRGLTDADNTAIYLSAINGGAASGNPCYQQDAAKKNGTTTQALAATNLHTQWTNNGTVIGTLLGTGRHFIGGATTPTSWLHLAAGTAAASSSPLKFTSGTNLTTAEAGAVEYDATSLFFTNGGAVRQMLPQVQMSRTTTTYTTVSTTTLSAIPSLTANLVTGHNYKFRIELDINGNAGSGVKISVDGTATASSNYHFCKIFKDSGANLALEGRATALNTTFDDGGSLINYGQAIIEGLIQCNGTGTLIPRIAAGTFGTITVGANSSMIVTEIP